MLYLRDWTDALFCATRWIPHPPLTTYYASASECWCQMDTSSLLASMR